MTQTITVAKIESPAGKGPGKVIDTVGSVWQVWGDGLRNFSEGGIYELTNVAEKEYNGKIQYTIKAARKIGGGARLNADASVRDPISSGGRPSPMPAASHSSNYDHMKDRHIYVCGALNHSLGNPSINPFELSVDQIVALTNRFRVAWERTLGPKAPPIPAARGENNDEFGDDIKF